MIVYISSTFLDLRDERRAVERAVLRLGHQPLGMESYVAEDRRPLDKCLEDVARADVYVGIFGWRYGSQVTQQQSAAARSAGRDLGELEPDASVTEHEFTYAAKVTKPRLVFLTADDLPWNPRYIDGVTGQGSRGSLIERFRARARESTISYFRSPDDLAAMVSAALYRLEAKQRIHSVAFGQSLQLQNALITHGSLTDTTLMTLQTAVLETESGNVVRVDLQANAWWVTRLYLLAALASEFGGDPQLLFRDQSGRFIGLASATAVRESMARLRPVLMKFDRDLGLIKLPPDLNSSLELVVKRFEAAMSKAGGELEVGGTVRRQDVRRWLGDRLQTRPLELNSQEPTNEDFKRILEWPMRFVPVQTGREIIISDRSVLAEHIAALALKDLEGRSIVTTATITEQIVSSEKV
jgi:hypothetical protein